MCKTINYIFTSDNRITQVIFKKIKCLFIHESDDGAETFNLIPVGNENIRIVRPRTIKAT